MNICTRCPRLVPTARAIPISCCRSDASSTKIRKISSNPTITENDPKNVKNVKKILPTCSAISVRNVL